MLIAVTLAALSILWLVYTYNSFASLKNRARNAWADINVELKRRHDLIPNLVATVKGYAEHEKTTLEEIAKLRTRAVGMNNVSEISGVENDLSGAIKSLFAVAESYPDLKADDNFRDLQNQLAEIENHVMYARKYYNAVVRDYNTKCDTFPSGIIGGWFGHSKLDYFQVNDLERESRQIDLNGGQ